MAKSGRKAKVDSERRARREQDRKASLVDQLMEFENFKETILPAIQKDLSSGLTAQQLREKYLAMVQASVITTALVDRDGAKRISAGKDVLDRAEGKAKDRIETTHRLEKLPDEQLDSLLLSELKEVNLSGSSEDLPN